MIPAMTGIALEEFVWRLAAAILGGLIVGIDREIKNKPLGARSYMIVSGGAAAWTMITLDYAIALVSGPAEVMVDPSRVVQGIVGSIGFLGAGAILSRRERGHLSGVASGAAIWGAGAIGVACGAGQITQALVVSLAFFLVLNLYDLILRIAGAAASDRGDDSQAG